MITRSVTFEAAHRLPRVPKGHKCARHHGHTYQIEMTVAGPVDDRTGWVAGFDFADVDRVLAGLRAMLDHQDINELGLGRLDGVAQRAGPSYMGLAVADFVQSFRAFAASEPTSADERPRLALAP